MSEPFAIITSAGQVVGERALKEYSLHPKSKQLSYDVFYKQYGTLGLAEPHYKLEQLAGLMEVNTFHARCIKTKANDVAGVGWELAPKVDNPDEAQKKTAEDILGSQWLSLTDTLVRMIVDYEAIGNGYLEIGREGGDPNGRVLMISHIPGHTVRVHKDENKYCQVRGMRRAWFKAFGYEMDVDVGSGEEHPLGSLPLDQRANEILAFRSYTARSDYYGVPDVLPALGSILGNQAAEEYNIKFFSNFGVPSYAVYISGDYELGEPDENGEYEIVKMVREYFEGLSKKPHSTLVFGIPSRGGGQVQVEIKPLAVDIKDASFKLYRKDNRDEVFSAHGVPPYRAGVAETGSLGGSTAQMSDRIYFESIITPRQRMIEDVFNHYILPTWGVTDWSFSLNRIFEEEWADDQATAQFLFSSGAMTPNQLIAYFGERFGIQPDPTNPLLEAYYLGGKELGAETPAPSMLETFSKAASPEEVLQAKLGELYNKAGKKLISRLKEKGIPAEDLSRKAMAEELKKLTPQFQEAAFELAKEQAAKSAAKVAAGIGTKVGEFLPSVEENLKKTIFQACERTMERVTGNVMDNLAKSYADGLGIKDAASRLGEVFDGLRNFEAERTARTVINSAQNSAAHSVLADHGEYRQWITANDERVRGNDPKDTADHVSLHNMIAAPGEPYPNGLMFPGDTSGDTEEWINCRCTEVPYFMPAGKMAPPGLPCFFEDDIIDIEVESMEVEE